MSFNDIISLIKENFKEAILSVDEEAIQPSITIDKKDILSICQLLHSNDKLYFDHLSCLSGMDYGEGNDLGVVYHLYSIPYDLNLVIKVKLNRSEPNIDSITSIWKGANWHEREAYDMFGIQFNNHPELRRILMPADWEGHPLRKDYKEQEKYHGIKVEY